MKQSITTAFTREVQSFLVKEGYTHIYCKGIDNDCNEDNDVYILIPYKKEDILIESGLNLKRFEEINHTEVFDMADGDEFIRFTLEMKTDDYQKYLKIR